jgi:hypothetical protein
VTFREFFSHGKEIPSNIPKNSPPIPKTIWAVLRSLSLGLGGYINQDKRILPFDQLGGRQPLVVKESMIARLKYFRV